MGVIQAGESGAATVVLLAEPLGVKRAQSAAPAAEMSVPQHPKSNRHGMIKTKALNPLAHGSRDGKDGSRPAGRGPSQPGQSQT